MDREAVAVVPRFVVGMFGVGLFSILSRRLARRLKGAMLVVEVFEDLKIFFKI